MTHWFSHDGLGVKRRSFWRRKAPPGRRFSRPPAFPSKLLRAGSMNARSMLRFASTARRALTSPRIFPRAKAHAGAKEPGRLVIGADQTLGLRGPRTWQTSDNRGGGGAARCLFRDERMSFIPAVVPRAKMTILFETVVSTADLPKLPARISSKPIWKPPGRCADQRRRLSDRRYRSCIFSSGSKATIRRSWGCRFCRFWSSCARKEALWGDDERPSAAACLRHRLADCAFALAADPPLLAGEPRDFGHL